MSHEEAFLYPPLATYATVHTDSTQPGIAFERIVESLYTRSVIFEG